MRAKLLEVTHLQKQFPIKGGLFRHTVGQLKAVDDVCFTIDKGRTFGLVGESGCGKSTLGRTILRLLEPTAGKVVLDGREITALDRKVLTAHRRDMQIIFQDPYASLSPRRTILQTLLEPLQTHRIGDTQSRHARVEQLLEVVSMPSSVLHRYPHEFSGGQRQRIGIARALMTKPKFIVADEAVSALDVSVQSQVLNLIAQLKRDLGISFLFISHDLAVVQHISDHIGVMFLGRLVEVAPAERLYSQPQHPYTRALLSAIPVPDPKSRRKRMILQGDVPSPLNPPSGCPFRTRCPEVMPQCSNTIPQLNAIDRREPAHLVACHLYSP